MALLARRQSGSTADARTWELLGKGEAGPSNLAGGRSPRRLAALEQAVQGAFAAAIMPRTMVAAACLGLAGADRAEEKELLLAWAKRGQLADRVEVTSDASLLLAAGTPDGWGLAVVAGTGSMVFGKAQTAAWLGAGGWGYLLGDEGSGYAIGLGGAASRAASRRRPRRANTAERPDPRKAGASTAARPGRGGLRWHDARGDRGPGARCGGNGGHGR